jgi:hypothetical protein
MPTKMKKLHWFPLLLIAMMVAGAATVCQAQNPITISFDSGVPASFYDNSPNNPGGTLDYFWQSTNGPDGPSSGCEVYEIDGVTNQEIDPAFNVAYNGADYAILTFQVKVDSSSGTVGTAGSGGYGHIQIAALTSSYQWNSAYYASIFPPAANGWVTYTASVPTVQTAHLQIQLQGGSAYSGPVKVYIGNISILPPPDPLVLQTFTSSSFTWQNYGMAGSWDGSQDAPYYNPVNGAGPTNITPAGSFELSPNNGQYAGGQLNLNFSPQLYQYVGVDVYYDGPTTPTNDYGGFQLLVANGQSPYNWVYIGHVVFNASMIGQWTHFNFPSASSGVTAAAGFAIQSIPGNGAGQNPFIFHLDNIQLWNPQVHPQITSFTPNKTPGGVQIAVDGDGTSNPDDQEGITTPLATNSVADFFWINQTPATYSFTLTNFPAPAVAPSFDAHIYILNGDTLASGSTGGFGYNEGYSGVNYNAYDAVALDVINGTNGGVGVDFTWKTNTPSSNITNGIFCTLSNLASANGTWALNFSDNTHASITLNGTVVTNFTLPDFYSDPNYTANFNPGTSFIDIGVYKNGQNGDDNQSAIFTDVLLTNTTVAISDNFPGPGLTGTNAWVVSEYYQDAANRATWFPTGTAFWLEWNSSQAGFTVESATNLVGAPWASAGVTYSYIDGTGTNTIAAVPSATLPLGGVDFFNLVK